ncbi:MAG: DUF4169 family protein [Alphaproteobacteria bacterium]|nr:DUF4169 family protein [Alphaproteobacteria bacterium]
MAEIVNLNKARKRKARDAKQNRAAENRVRFGLSKAEKAAEAARREAEKRGLDGQLIEDRDGGTEREP